MTSTSIQPSIPIITHVEHIDDEHKWEEYKITVTNGTKQFYLICKMDTTSQCCEQFYFGATIPDGFIGSAYVGTTVVVNRASVPDDYDDYARELYVTIHTSSLPMVITCTNRHNGYYVHDVYVKTDTIDTYYKL